MINLLNYLNYNMALRLFLIFITINFAYSQNYWQQHVDYQMDIDMNVEDFTFKGTQKIVYTNNSPDTLNKVYYHLFFNDTATTEIYTLHIVGSVRCV